MKYLNYICVNDSYSERVDVLHADPVEVAAVIDRALLPLAQGAECGHANSRRTVQVRGELGAKLSTLVLSVDGEQLAAVVVCLHSRSSAGGWSWLREHSPCELPDMLPPAAPWVALRYDCTANDLPHWIDSWAKNAGLALLRREGW
jgi:hypothetical protein